MPTNDLTGELEDLGLAQAIFPSQYDRTDGKVTAIMRPNGWVLRSISGPSWFWNHVIQQWDISTLVPMDDPAHLRSKEETLKLLPHLTPQGEEAPKFVVRLWDMLDGWIDITGSLSKGAADEVWNEKTDGGKRNTKYADGDYYRIFPADTRMLVTPEAQGR